MSECPHCRAPSGTKHRHDCSVARKTGQERMPVPVRPLYVGAVVAFWSGNQKRAAVVVAESPVVLRVLDDKSIDYDIFVKEPEYGSGAGQWSWPA